MRQSDGLSGRCLLRVSSIPHRSSVAMETPFALEQATRPSCIHCGIRARISVSLGSVYLGITLRYSPSAVCASVYPNVVHLRTLCSAAPCPPGTRCTGVHSKTAGQGVCMHSEHLFKHWVSCACACACVRYVVCVLVCIVFIVFIYIQPIHTLTWYFVKRS